MRDLTQLPMNADGFALQSRVVNTDGQYWTGYADAVLAFVPVEKRKAFVNWAQDDAMRVKQYIWDPSDAVDRFMQGGQS